MKTMYLMMSIYPPPDDARPMETMKISKLALVAYSTPEQLKAEIEKAQATLAAWSNKAIAALEDLT